MLGQKRRVSLKVLPGCSKGGGKVPEPRNTVAFLEKARKQIPWSLFGGYGLVNRLVSATEIPFRLLTPKLPD